MLSMTAITSPKGKTKQNKTKQKQKKKIKNKKKQKQKRLSHPSSHTIIEDTQMTPTSKAYIPCLVATIIK